MGLLCCINGGFKWNGIVCRTAKFFVPNSKNELECWNSQSLDLISKKCQNCSLIVSPRGQIFFSWVIIILQRVAHSNMSNYPIKPLNSNLSKLEKISFFFIFFIFYFFYFLFLSPYNFTIWPNHFISYLHLPSIVSGPTPPEFKNQTRNSTRNSTKTTPKKLPSSIHVLLGSG